MTENSLTSSTQSAPSFQTQTALSTLDRPATQDAIPKVNTKKDDDSILCICGWDEDDGSTIFCEDCRTWQHIVCYYPGMENKEIETEFKHVCVDCDRDPNPRVLDRKAAVEARKTWLVERRRRAQQFVGSDPHDKKTKKPLPKTHKKKVKPTDLQLNGHVMDVESSKLGSPHDTTTVKKAKHTHKASPSLSTQARKRSPSHGVSKPMQHGHPLSPATTPPDLPMDVEFYPYVPQFLLQPEETPKLVRENTTANLELTSRMAIWSRPENDCFWKDTHSEFDDIVQRRKPSLLQPPLSVDEIELPGSKGMTLRWRRLITPSAVEKGTPLMEINGIVGLQKDYCEDTDNRYFELSAPLPFVFFPEHIPLYIDTRREGSDTRYVRRSCRRNARLATFLHDSRSPADWHFWLVSDRAIAENEEVTLGWDFSLPQPNGERMQRLLGLSTDDPDEHSVADIVADIDHSDFETLYKFITRLLAEYGGCACNRGEDCAFRQFVRQYQERVQLRPSAPKRKRAKSKPHTLSPTSTSQATNSRAASEGHADEVPEHDQKSTTGSSRSKPASRERTPARLGSFDTLGILTEPTNRDKRKVQIAETLFQKSAQEQQPPRKKKKSATDGSTGHASTKAKGRNSISQVTEKPNALVGSNSVDAGLSDHKEVSPTGGVSQAAETAITNAASRHSSVASAARLSTSSADRSYRDTAAQADKDPEPFTWRSVRYPNFKTATKPRPQKRVMSLTMRLMAQKSTTSLLAQQLPASAMDLDSPVAPKSESPIPEQKQLPPSSPASASVDLPMPDAPPVTADARETGSVLEDDSGSKTAQARAKSPGLRVQMPSVQAFTSPTSSTTETTPMSANTSTVQSPFSSNMPPSPLVPLVVNGTTANPSPIKKKMSLSEYKNKANKAAASAKTTVDVPHPLRTASLVAVSEKPTIPSDHEGKEAETSLAEPSAMDTAV